MTFGPLSSAGPNSAPTRSALSRQLSAISYRMRNMSGHAPLRLH
jgi:hypothetical protein